MDELEKVGLIRRCLGDHCVVFIGMMGSGKSAIGRLTAARLDLPFFDSDQEITTAADMSIPDLFDQFGEQYFRRGEQRVIARLLDQGPAVISLGGGAFMNEATREAVGAKAVSVWLRADLDMLMNRVLRRPGTRPLLQTADPRATLAGLMEVRTPVYALADLTIDSSDHSKKHTSDRVIDGLYDWFSSDNDAFQPAEDNQCDE